ncbi:Gag-like protein [Elysia marginata]|uniref:Gag-like protein n=1 Tax=Elysia marginata TaxID=1093978 RepID=A0AAV4EJ18_9GAST|nr:Gag-like protein [Elysia marginata]
MSPFRLHMEVHNILNKDIKMSKTGRGVLLEVDTRMDEERLMRMNELAGVKVKVTREGYLNTSRGVVKHIDLKRCESEEFLEYVLSVINARRIEIRRGRGRSRRIHSPDLQLPHPAPKRFKQDTCL